MKELDLGTGKIGSLIKRFSIPCVISMVVAALYNIVDQIFIGWSEAGAYGNAATNIVYPFTVFALGIALLIGDGAAAGFSIALGRGDKKQANKNVGNSVKSTILALLRDVIVFVPVSIVIGMITKNIVTMLWAAMISDVVSAIFGFRFVSTEIHKIVKMYDAKEKLDV